MKKIYLLSFTTLLTAVLFLSNVFAQDYTQWRLPEGAKARFGKGWINDIEFSPSGDQISVATTIGIWIYDVHTGREVNLFTGDMSGANAIAYNSDGNILAAAHWDRTVRLWNVNSSLPTTSYYTFSEHPGPIYAVAISPNGRMIASGGASRTDRSDDEPSGLIRMWDFQTRDPLPILPYNAPVSTIAFSPNSRWIAGGSGDGTVRVWDAGTGDRIYEFNDHEEPVWKVDFSPDSQWLVSVSLDGTGFLRNLRNPDLQASTLKQHGTSIYAVSFSPDDSDNSYIFATGSADNRIRLWKTHANNDNQLLPDNPSLDGHNDSVWMLAFSKDGKDLASGSLDGTVRLWDTDIRRERLKISGHTGGVKALTYTEDNRILACGTGLDGILRLWDAGTSGQLSILLDHAGLNNVVAFSSDGRTLASAGSENDTILLSDIPRILNMNFEDSLVHSLTGNQHGITAIALSSPVRDPRSSFVPNRLASGGKDARIHLLDVTTSRELTTLRGAESTVTALTFDPTSKSLFSGEENGTVREWNALTGIERFNFKNSFNTITALAFSPNARLLATGDEDGEIRVLNFAEKRQEFITTRHTRKITALVFAENGTTLFSGSEDGTILLWDMNEVALRIEEQAPPQQQNQSTEQQDRSTAKPDAENHGITPQQIAETSQKSTVHLAAADRQGDIFGMGSGFFIRPGYVATNHHVIQNATWIYIKGVGEEEAYVVEGVAAIDESHDLAILKATQITAPALNLGNSDEVQTGETVYVVSNPKGYEGTFSKGIVSGIRRDGNNTWIQIDAPISPGSSGGAVLNSSGQVIGIATARHRDEDAQNLNFVVPSNYLKTLLRQVQ